MLGWTKREPPVATSAGAASSKLRVRTRSYLDEFPIMWPQSQLQPFRRNLDAEAPR